MKEIADKIKKAGGNLYLVGGALRDELLGKQTHDEDYCVTGLTSEQFQELFPQSHIQGKSFEVFVLDGKEFAMARKETKLGEGHKQFEIETNPNITIEEDLARRDITINSIAKDVLTGKIIDPFNGREDLKNHIIRATTLHFKEDPLRVYRVARFSAGLQFNVEENTINLMRELKNELNTLSKERVYTEFSKALLTDKPSIFFDILRKSDTLDVHFKEVKDLIGAEQPVQYHPEGDAYNHTMLVLDKATELTSNFTPNRKLEIRFSALVHDFGKGVTPKEQYPHHYGHGTAGAKIVNKFGHNIKAPNNLIKCGKTACLEHMRGGIFYKMKPSKKVEFIERVSKSILGLDGLQIIVMADKTSGGRENNIDDISFEKIGKRCLKEINGEYIEKKYNLKPGLQFGNKLHEERIKWIKENLNNIQN